MKGILAALRPRLPLLVAAAGLVVGVVAAICVVAVLDTRAWWIRAAAAAATLWLFALQAGLSALTLRDRSRFPRTQILRTSTTVARIAADLRALPPRQANTSSTSTGARPRRSRPIRPATQTATAVAAGGRPGVGRTGTPGVVGESERAPLLVLTGAVSADDARRRPALIGDRSAFPGVPEAFDAHSLRPGMGSEVLQSWNPSLLLVDREAFREGPWAGTESASGTLLLLDWLDLTGWCRDYDVPVYLLDSPTVPDANTAALLGGADLVFPLRDGQRLEREGWGAPQTALFERLQELGLARQGDR